MPRTKSRLVLPSHLISSSQIDLALAESLTPASTASGGDFDRLMVPFRCVASDLVARKPYVLKTGDLGEAVRASMAIPLAFNPIEKDSMLLYDGGIYDNFPWKPLDETFRPDYLIGSKCTSGNTEPNAKSIMDQVWMLTMEKTDYDMPAGRSTLIERAVDVSMLDFSQADAIIQSGYDDTMALMGLAQKRRSAPHVAGRGAAPPRRLPRTLPRAAFQPLRDRGAESRPDDLRARQHAARPPARRRTEDPFVRAGEGQILLGAGRRQFLHRIPLHALRSEVGLLRHRFPADDQARLQNPDRR